MFQRWQSIITWESIWISTASTATVSHINSIYQINNNWHKFLNLKLQILFQIKFKIIINPIIS
jgi:hypothetical protein